MTPTTTYPSTLQWIQDLRRQGIKISSQGDRLRIQAAPEQLTPTLKEELRQRKEELLSLLGEGTSVAPIRRLEQPGPIPLSFGQQRLWFMDTLQGANSIYNIPAALRLQGRLHLSALEASLHAIVDRHAVLRTVIATQDGQPFQEVRTAAPIQVHRVDLRGLAEDERDTHVRRLAMEEAHLPFELAEDPMLRAQLIQTASDDHVLLLTTHHIASDAWSMSILVRELAAFYGTFAQATSQAPTLPDLAIQYTDYAIWQRNRPLDDGLSFWQRQLTGAPLLELPLDFPRPPIQDHRGDVVRHALAPGTTQRIHQMAKDHGATPFVVLLAGFALVLSRHCDQEDLVLGTPVAGRHRPELEGLIGLFLNTLALRVDLSGNPTFEELLRRLKDTVFTAHEHQDIPFEKVVEALRPDRSTSRPPIVEVMINFINTPSMDFGLPGLTLTSIEQDEPSAKLPMTLHVREVGEHLELALGYQTALFTGDRMAHLLDQVAAVLSQGTARPSRPIADISLVTEASQHLVASLDDPLSSAPHAPITVEILETIRRHPQQPAIVQGREIFTYGELGERAKELATALREKGLETGERVAIDGPRSVGFVVSMLGVMLAGGVFVSLDPDHPPARHQLMLREAGATFRIDLGTAKAPVPEIELVDLGVDATTGRLREPQTAPQPLPEISAQQDAYIFFTSGSTGTPKAVLGWHRALGHFVRWFSDLLTITSEDRVAHLAGISFDGLLKEVLPTLACGATLHIPSRTDLEDGQAFLGWLAEQDITLLNTVPSRAQSWLHPEPPPESPWAPRWLTFAGEPLRDTLIQGWRQAFPNTGGILNFYGATEITVLNTTFRVPDPPLPGIQLAGFARPETQALVMRGDHRCGLGEIGEIVLRSPFCTRGYFNRPEETQERFRPNPRRPSIAEDRLYYTGDRGRLRLDGSLEVLGRLDDQVKIHGMRVEPGEVSGVLAKHPEIADCTVVERSQDGMRRLVAYFVPRQGSDPDIDALRRHLAQRLPRPMVPGIFVPLTALPLTPNGKVDRRALPAPRQLVAKEPEPPATPTEATLVELWTELLPVDRVPVTGNFFDLGGHSLLATRVVSRIRPLFGLDLPVSIFFEIPTLRGIAERIDLLLQARRVAHTGPRDASAPRKRGKL